MLEKDFNWNYTDKAGHFHEWDKDSTKISPFLDDDETFTVLYHYFDNTVMCQCHQCKEVFLAKVKGGCNAV